MIMLSGNVRKWSAQGAASATGLLGRAVRNICPRAAQLTELHAAGTGIVTPALLASLSRRQKTSSPTFHVLSWRTEVPIAPLATFAPIADRSYFTFAWVAEVSTTVSTLEVTADASGLEAKALIDDENSEPFCSS